MAMPTDFPLHRISKKKEGNHHILKEEVLCFINGVAFWIKGVDLNEETVLVGPFHGHEEKNLLNNRNIERCILPLRDVEIRVGLPS